jgi:hypothetical protein
VGLRENWKRKPRNLPQKIMFWSYSHRPQDFVGRSAQVSKRRVDLVRVFLKSGERDIGYAGWADCRICGARLGTCDMKADGYLWPQLAEHYIEEHGVWTPKMDALGRALEVVYYGRKR